jgi:glycerol kinase
MQLQADLSGTSVLRPKTADLSALGAAHLAGLAAGLWSLEDLDVLPRPRDEFTPATSADWRDSELAFWRAAIRRTRYRPEQEDPKEDA